MYLCIEFVSKVLFDMPLKALLVALFVSFSILMLPILLIIFGCMGWIRGTWWWIRACVVGMGIQPLAALDQCSTKSR